MFYLFESEEPKEIEEYDPEKHGGLAEAPVGEGIIETYPIEKPWAEARVREDPDTGDRLYEVFEPELSEDLKKHVDFLKDLLTETIDLDLREFSEDRKTDYLRNRISDLIEEYGIDVGPKSREKIIYYVLRDFQGYGKSDPLMHDERIEDISCDGPGRPVFIYHREYGPLRTNICYEQEEEIQSFIVKLAQRGGKHISIANPLVDATLPDGSRVQLSYGSKVTTKGSTYTMRKFREKPFSPPELVKYGTVSSKVLAYLWLAVDSDHSVLFAGGTASGKTTTLNATSLFIPPESKVVSIEDTRELNIPHENWIPGLVRGGFQSGQGEIDMYDLLESAVRQRPDYLLVGEVRGEEAYVLFQAMSTGHIVMSTIHSESARGVFRRLRSSPMDVSLSLLESVDIICVQARRRVGGERVRRFTQVAELVDVDYDKGEIQTEDVFGYDSETDDFEFYGSPRVFDEVAKEWSLGEEELEEEFDRRKAIIEKAVEEGVMDYQEFWKRVVKYRSENGGLD